MPRRTEMEPGTPPTSPPPCSGRRVLRPLAAAVDAVALRRRGVLPRAGPEQLPTIAVHGLALGGTGKTPLCVWLAGRLDTLLGPPVAIGTREPSVVADEAAMLARLPGRRPVLAERRPAEAIARARAAGCRAVVLDDPSLSRAAPAHFRIACLGPGDAWDAPAFPAGSRRPGSVRPGEVDHAALFDGAGPSAGGPPATRARTVVRGLAPLAAGAGSGDGAVVRAGRGAAVFVACAIGRPERVVRALESAGVAVVGARFLADHSSFPAALRARVEGEASARGARAVVVTGKDAARLPPGFGGERLPWLAVLADVELEGEGSALLEAIRLRVGA